MTIKKNNKKASKKAITGVKGTPKAQPPKTLGQGKKADEAAATPASAKAEAQPSATLESEGKKNPLPEGEKANVEVLPTFEKTIQYAKIVSVSGVAENLEKAVNREIEQQATIGAKVHSASYSNSINTAVKFFSALIMFERVIVITEKPTAPEK